MKEIIAYEMVYNKSLKYQNDVICVPFQAPLPIIHRVSYRWKIPVSCGFVALQDVFRSASYRLVLGI